MWRISLLGPLVLFGCGGDDPPATDPSTTTGTDPSDGDSTGEPDEGPPLPPMEQVMLPSELRASSVAAADMDGDGNLDFVISDEVGASPLLQVWAGDGTGLEFTSTLEQAVSREYVELWAGDYEGDGDADILGRTGMGNRMYTHAQDMGQVSDGDFDALDGPPIGPAHDVNDDGLLDHAYVGDGEIRLRLAFGDGGFRDGPSLDVEGCEEIHALAFGALEGTDQDAVVSATCGGQAQLRVLARSSGGGFTPVQELEVPEPWIELALADLDDDGLLDAAGSTFAPTPDDFPSLLMIRRGTGDPGFEEEGRQIEFDHTNATLRSGDVDGDGRPELLTSSIGTSLADPHEDNRFVLLRLRGGLEATPLPQESSALLVADFNGDGCGDVFGRAAGEPVLLVTDCSAAPEADSSSGG